MPRQLDPNKRAELLKFLRSYFAAHDCMPSFDEMELGTGLSRCSIRLYLNWLIKDKLARQEPDKPRTFRLTDKGRSYPDHPEPRVAAYISKAARINATMTGRTVQLPVVGRTFAGQTTPIPNSDFSATTEFDTIEVTEDMLPPRYKPGYCYVLEVSGDSMIEAGIFNGDYVICRQSDTAQNNDMVVALLTDKDETTLKYFFRENGHIRLQPANSEMEPILIYDTSHLIIQGVVVQVVRAK